MMHAHCDILHVMWNELINTAAYISKDPISVFNINKHFSSDVKVTAVEETTPVHLPEDESIKGYESTEE